MNEENPRLLRQRSARVPGVR